MGKTIENPASIRNRWSEPRNNLFNDLSTERAKTIIELEGKIDYVSLIFVTKQEDFRIVINTEHQVH